MKMRLHAVEHTVTALGPGIRYAIWVQGCPHHCPGCISPENHDPEGGYETDSEAEAERILQSGRDGITISGGEPFWQADALADLICRVKAGRDIGVIIYTGYTLEQLQKMDAPGVQKLLGLCDLLIDGPYVEEKNDGKSLRGSSNQRVIPLTERYRREARNYGRDDAYVEFFVHENAARMVGIPSREILERFRNQKW